MSKPRERRTPKRSPDPPSPREDEDAARVAAIARYDALRERGKKLDPARRAGSCSCESCGNRASYE